MPQYGEFKRTEIWVVSKMADEKVPVRVMQAAKIRPMTPRAEGRTKGAKRPL